MKGIDVSSNQHPGNRPIDWEAVYDAGYSFVIVKATQGTGYQNPWLERDLEDAFAAGLFIGAYHYWEGDEDPELQAKTFVSALIGHKLDMGTWLDFEPPAESVYLVTPKLNAFLAEARTARPGIGLYCDLSWRDELKAANALPARLWLAAWGHEAPADAIIWQDATNVEVPGVPALVDTNVLLKTRSLNLASSPPPQPRAATTHGVRLAAETGPDAGGEGQDKEQDEGLNDHGEPAP